MQLHVECILAQNLARASRCHVGDDVPATVQDRQELQ